MTEETMLQSFERRLGKKTDVSIAEVSIACNVSCSLVSSWIKKGLIEAVNLSANKRKPYYRIHVESVARFLKSRMSVRI